MSTPADVRDALAVLDAASTMRATRHGALQARAASEWEALPNTLDRHVTPDTQQAAAHVDVLSQRLTPTARLAQDLYTDMNTLHEERARIETSMHWCAQTLQLRTSLQALARALEQQDWAASVQHCTAASAVDPEILQSQFAAMIVVRTC